MRVCSNEYKEAIKGINEIDSKIIYKLNNETITLGTDELNNVTPVFQGSILKSVMKELDIDSNIDIPIGTILNYKFGIKVGETYEYVDYGNYVVYSSEKQEDYDSYKIICYDKMLYSMKQNEDLGITYPISIRDYIKAICTKIGLEFKNTNDTFANYDKMISQELYAGLDYTYRDIFDELAQVTASTICLDKEDKVEIRYINDINVIIDEETLKDVNVNFGKKYGPVNSIVLSRSAESDNVYLQDEESIATNGLCEIKIKENQIMNWNDRSDYLPDILEKLDGLEYYLNDYSTFGITYLELCDRYNVKIGGNTYSCILFNDEFVCEQGIEENIHTDMPEETETDYTKADKTDRKINNVSLIVDKQQQEINLLNEKIVDISSTKSGEKKIVLENCSTTPIKKMKITGNDSLLFPGTKDKMFSYETFEGANVQINNDKHYDLNDITFDGRSVQETRSGKNLFNTTLINKSSYTSEGITTTWEDDLIKVNGTPTTNWANIVRTTVDEIEIGTYTISISETLSVNLGFKGKYEDDTMFDFAIYKNTKSTTFTTTKKIKQYYLYIAGLTSGTPINFSFKFQLEKGSTATDYEPYGLSPSPDFPSEIKNVDNIQFTISGKNIEQGIEQGGISNSGENYSSTTAIRSKYYNQVKPNTTYALSMNSATTSFNVAQYDENKNFISFTYANGKITTAENTRYIRLSKTATLNNNVQIEEGSIVTTYEPYQSQTINVNLEGNKLCSIGNVKDILKVTPNSNAILYKNIEQKTYNGTENWTLQSINNHDIANFQIYFDSYYIGGEPNLAMCDTFSPQTSLIADETNEGFYLNANKFLFIRIKKSRCSTVEEFKTWLSTHNINFNYVMGGTAENVLPATIEDFNLYDGINNISNIDNTNMSVRVVKSGAYLKNSYLYVNADEENAKIYDLKIPALRTFNGVKDEYLLEDGKATLTKKIGLNADLQKYVLDEPVVIDLGAINVELNEGTNILTMPSFPNNFYEVTYLLKNEYTNTFATQAQVTNQIKVASDEILIESKTQILENGDELIASINTQSTGNVLINASKLAEINANKINFNSYDFNVTTQNMKISIGQGDNKKDIINSNGVLTNLQFKSSNQVWGIGQSASYPLGFSPESEIQNGSEFYPSRKSYLQIDYDVPKNFVISNAYITIFHTPIYWDNGQYHTWGYCRNLGIFKVTNSGNFVISLAFFGEGETTGKFNTEIINNAFGDSTYWTARTPNNDSYLSENITTKDLTNNIDKTGHGTLLIQSNDTAPTSNTLAELYTANGAGGKTGSAYAILNIIGYTKI